MPKGYRTAGRLRTEEKLKHGLKMQDHGREQLSEQIIIYSQGRGGSGRRIVVVSQ